MNNRMFVAALSVIALALSGQSAASPTGDPVIAAAGDIACDPRPSAAPEADEGGGSVCHQAATAKLIELMHPAAVLALGDEQYPNGALDSFTAGYAPSWGAFKAITHPAPGNHEYHTPGAAGYFTYFGAAAGPPDKGYYSFDVGGWHLIALNANCQPAGGCGADSPEVRWLAQDLAAHKGACTLAYWHQPRWSSGPHHSDPTYDAFWQTLYAAHADVVLGGHDHDYERFSPQAPDGASDPGKGITEFVVGTGGRSHYQVKSVAPNSEARSNDTFGVLELTLHAHGFDWRFVPEQGSTFTDSGSRACHA